MAMADPLDLGHVKKSRKNDNIDDAAKQKAGICEEVMIFFLWFYHIDMNYSNPIISSYRISF